MSEDSRRDVFADRTLLKHRTEYSRSFFAVTAASAGPYMSEATLDSQAQK